MKKGIEVSRDGETVMLLSNDTITNVVPIETWIVEWEYENGEEYQLSFNDEDKVVKFIDAISKLRVTNIILKYEKVKQHIKKNNPIEINHYSHEVSTSYSWKELEVTDF